MLFDIIFVHNSFLYHILWLDVLVVAWKQSLYTRNVRKVIVMGLAPMGCAPHYLWRYKSKEGECIQYINDMIMDFNFEMRYMVEALNHQFSDANITFCDVFEGSMDIIRNHRHYGMYTTPPPKVSFNWRYWHWTSFPLEWSVQASCTNLSVSCTSFIYLSTMWLVWISSDRKLSRMINGIASILNSHELMVDWMIWSRKGFYRCLVYACRIPGHNWSVLWIREVQRVDNVSSAWNGMQECFNPHLVGPVPSNGRSECNISR